MPPTEPESGAFRGKRQPWAIERAVLEAVAYADVFEYPLTLHEVHRYLVRVSASFEEVASVLRSSRVLRAHLARRGEFYLLDGRDEIVDTRRRRAAVAADLWPPAVQYGHVIARLPFVRMVAVTGALAVDNVEPDTDIDYLIVTAPGRLWLCRALVVAVVRFAERKGVWLCPNYFLSENLLAFEERSLYAAHEVTQMVPIAGMVTYRRLRRLNAWTDTLLPNAVGPPGRLNGNRVNDAAVRRHPLRRIGEAVLRTGVGGMIEQWEMQRKVRKFTRHADDHVETNFSVDCCKGHFDSHGTRTLDAFNERMHKIGQAVDWSNGQIVE